MARRNKRGKFQDKASTSRRNDDRKIESKSKDRYEVNDAKWYTLNAQRVLDAGRLSFNVPTGSPIFLDFPNGTWNFNQPNNYSLPGVCALDFIPTYGVLKDYSDPLNVAARNLYSNIRYKNSGAKNYDPNDLMLYLCAMDNCYMWYQHLVRMYGVAMLYSQLNRHYPTTIFKAMNVDGDDIINNLSDFRTKINVYAAKLGSLCVPSNFPVFLRHMWMCSGIYGDSPTPKAQLYMFVPVEVGRYDETSSSRGGALVPEPMNLTRLLTREDLYTIMDDLIDGVMSSEDCGIISGDIRKAYEGSLFQIAQITDDYRVIPVYSEEVLRQIQNATVLNGYTNAYGYENGFILEQSENVDYLVSDIYFNVDSDAILANRILTGSDQQPSPEEVLVNSRLTVMGTVTHRGDGNSALAEKIIFKPTAIGTEAIVNMWVYGGQDYKYSTDTPSSPLIDRLGYILRYYSSPVGSGNIWVNVRRFLYAYSKMENFNYHPRVGTLTAETIDSTGVMSDVSNVSFQDIDNYAVIGENTLFNLHNTALLSLFNIPE